MKLLDRLPIPDRPHLVTVANETVQVYRNQILVWLSIQDPSRPLPAILDTGHGHNLLIGEGQFQRWSGASLRRIGELQIDRRTVVQYAADVRLHRNRPGSSVLRGDNHALEMPQGISVMPDEHAPRLPLIGLRAIVANRLRLVIDGKKGLVTLHSPGWF
jgi:hypothetical protein